MSLTFIIGPPAVGKMTVGQELERRTGHKLFHNHVPIELVAPYFSYGTPQGRGLVNRIRSAFFDAFCANSDGSYIFTFVWAFGEPGESEYIEDLAEKFKVAGHEVFCVELTAPFDERLARNRSSNRLDHKPTKRNLDWSDQHIREVEGKYRFNSTPGEIPFDNYLYIDNTTKAASIVAAEICAAFGFASVDTA